MSETGSPSLLIVDDEPELRGLLAECFGRHGFAVRRAEHAAAARAAISAERPDLAILDVNMPGETGLTLARWRREAHPAAAPAAAPATRPPARSPRQGGWSGCWWGRCGCRWR